MELSGLCDRRQPATISGSAVVLGITCKKTFYQRIYLIRPRSVSYGNHDDPCTTNVDRWNCHIHRPARLLSSGSWADSFILQNDFTPKNYFGRYYFTRREASSIGIDLTSQWFFVMVLIQNFSLALPFSHNWRYLWSS